MWQPYLEGIWTSICKSVILLQNGIQYLLSADADWLINLHYLSHGPIRRTQFAHLHYMTNTNLHPCWVTHKFPLTAWLLMELDNADAIKSVTVEWLIYRASTCSTRCHPIVYEFCHIYAAYNIILWYYKSIQLILLNAVLVSILSPSNPTTLLTWWQTSFYYTRHYLYKKHILPVFIVFF